MNSIDYKLNIIVNYNGQELTKQSKDMLKLEEIKNLVIDHFKLSKEEEEYLKFKNENNNSIQTDDDIINYMNEIDEENYKININLLLDKPEKNKQVIKSLSKEINKMKNDNIELDLNKSNSTIFPSKDKQESEKRKIKELIKEFKKVKEENKLLKSENINIKKEKENIKNSLSIEYKNSLSHEINQINLNYQEKNKKLLDENLILRNEYKELYEKCKKLEKENLELKNKIKELESNKILFEKNEQNIKLQNTFKELKNKEIEKEIISKYNDIIKNQIEKTIKNEFKIYEEKIIISKDKDKDKDLEKEKKIENQNDEILKEIKLIKEILQNQNKNIKEENEVKILENYTVNNNIKKENENKKDDLNMNKYRKIFESNNNHNEINNNENLDEIINININEEKINNDKNKGMDVNDNNINNYPLENLDDENDSFQLSKKFSNESLNVQFLPSDLRDISFTHDNN